MKKNTKRIILNLGEDFSFFIDIEGEKISVFPTFSLFSIGKEKDLASFLCFKRENNNSILNFKNKVTTNFDIKIFEEDYESSRIIRVISALNEEFNYYAVDSTNQIFYNPENNTKVRKTIITQSNTIKYTFINSNEDEITYITPQNNENIISPVEYNYKNSVSYSISNIGITSSLNNNFKGPKVDLIKNSDGSIREMLIYSTKYDADLSENKYKQICYTYTGEYITKIVINYFNGKTDTYNLSYNSSYQWRFEHLESNKYVLFNFDATGNLSDYIIDDIGSENQNYVVNFSIQNDHVKMYQNNGNFTCFAFDENNNLSYEFDNYGNINFIEYLAYKKEYLKLNVSTIHNLRYNKTKINNDDEGNNNSSNLLCGNFSEQVLGDWTFNSGGTGTYSFVNNSLNNDFFIFTNGCGTKVSVTPATTAAQLLTIYKGNLSNRKFIFSGFYKSIAVGSSPEFTLIFLAKNKGVYTGENIVYYFDTSIINKTKFFMKEIFFTRDIDEVEIKIEFYRGSTIEIYNFSFLEEIFGTLNFYNENGILYKKINGFDISRTKIYDGNLRESSFYNKNIKIDNEVVTGNEITKTIYTSQNVKNVKKINKNNGFIKSIETIYEGEANEKIKEEYTYSDNGLLTSKKDYFNVTSTFNYYLNTDLVSYISSLTHYAFVYNNSSTRSAINSNIANPYVTDYIDNFSERKIEIKENDQSLYDGQYNADGGLVYFKYNNEFYIQNLYIKGNYSSDKYLSSLNIHNNNEILFKYDFIYDSKDNLNGVSYGFFNIFGFEYDDLENLSKINLIESNDYYDFSYDSAGILNGVSTKNGGIVINKDKGKLYSTKESFANHSVTSFKQTYENRNAVIVNELMATLKEKPYYVGLFDSLIDPDDEHEEFRFLKLINKFYEKDDFISLNFFVNSISPYIYNVYNLSSLRLFKNEYFTFSKNHSVINSKISGTLGFAFVINNIYTSQQSLIKFNINNYLINLYYLKDDNKLRLFVKHGDSPRADEFYDVFYEEGDFNFISLSYECTSTSLKITLYGNNIFETLEIANNCTITNTTVTYIIFDLLPGLSMHSTNHFYITGIIYNNKMIPLSEVINHFNILSKIASLSDVYKENFNYCPNGSGSINYMDTASQFTWIPLRDSLKDSNNSYPITNFGYKNPFIFHLMTLGNCYYAYHNKLVYRTNLKEKGSINFKTNLFKISANQPYFCLKCPNLYIKVYVDKDCYIHIKVNNTVRALYSLSEDDLLHEHAITFSYALSSGVFYYNLQFSNHSVASGNVVLNINELEDFFDLYLGCSNEQTILTDACGNTATIQNETFNGIFSDVVYSNNLDSLFYNNSLLTAYKNPIISDCFDDVFGREYQKRSIYQNKMVLNEKYDYKVINGNQTPLIDKEKILLNTTLDIHSGALNRSVLYEYDNKNRITKMIEISDQNGNDFSEKVEYEYTYDTNSYLTGSIITKTKKQEGTLVTVFSNEYKYSYNSDGDLLTKEENESGYSVSKSLIYDSNIKHQLIKIIDNNYIYDGLFLKEVRDNQGNLKQSFDYRGSKLKSYINNVTNTNIKFVYDHQGKRILKKNLNSGEEIKYFYDLQGNLIREQHNTFSLNYLYDAKGRVFSLIYQTNTLKIPYFYIRNQLNDVSEIVDSNANCIAKYIYNPYGKLIEVSGSNIHNIANLNPFRYRGYYYDVETQFYWVSSRYYSPELCRWISPDSIEYLDPQSINGLNLYCYCYNNPISYYDPSGHSAILVALLIGAITGGVIGGIYGGITAAANGQDVLAGVLIGILTGALMGAGAGVASLYLAPIIVGQAAVVGGVTYSAWAALVIGSVIAFGSGFIGGIAADALTQLVNDGGVNDWGSVFVSGLQWGFINTGSAFLGSLGGPVTTLDSALLSGVFGSVTSAVGMTIDILRNRKNQKQKVVASNQLYAYGF